MKRKRLSNREWVFKASKKGRRSKTFKTKSGSAQKYNNPEIPVGRTGLGNRTFVKLVYSQKINGGGTTLGTAGTLQFNLNSLFDPDRTGVGHQPMGFDQLAALYERYIVTRAEYKLTMVNSSTTQNTIYVINVSDAVTTSPDMEQYIEQGNCRVGMLTTANGGDAQVKLSGMVNLWELQGLDYSEYMSSNGSDALVSANPTDIGVLNIVTCDAGAGTCASWNGIIEITYYAHLRGSQLTVKS